MLMLQLADCLTLALPFIAILISIATAYVNSRHRSIDLAMKFSSLLEQNKDMENAKSFDQVVFIEAKMARSYYMWKGLSKLTDHKRSYFNYASFLVFTFGWIGMGITKAIETGSETGEISGVFLLGCVAMISAAILMAYSRYEATLYSSYLDLTRNDKYLPGYAAVYHAKDKVLNESIVPVVASFLLGLLCVYFFEPNIVNAIWNGIILICVVGNNVQIVRNEKKSTGKQEAKSEESEDSK